MNKNLNFKWNKETFSLGITTETTILNIKETIQGLKNIEIDRQKLLLKGKVLDNSTPIESIQDNSTLTLMGIASVETIICEKKAVFVEDLSQEEKAKLLREKGIEIYYGLQNLENTCFFNSTIQCLGRVPELREKLKNYQLQSGNDIQKHFAKELGNVFTQLDNASDTVVPYKLVTLLRAANPLFAEQEKGHYRQQDAEECWTFVINTIRDVLKNTSSDKFSNLLIDEIFGIEMEVNLVNVENPTEIKNKKEIIFKLPCYIDNTTVELQAGLKASLKENIDLYSDIVNKLCIFEKGQLISRLPPYLTVQYMRFSWKKANMSTGSKEGKAKILRSVVYSKTLDVYDLCNNSTKEILDLGRSIELKMKKNELDLPKEKMDVDSESNSMVPTGRYQLIAVLTHQGRSSESGHYIGWVHKKDDDWVKYDDDVVKYVKTQDILNLKGGGDDHINYISIYKRLEVPLSEL